MKIKIIAVLIVIFLVFCSFIHKTKPVISEFPLLGKVIVIDPGHGGRDPGTIYGTIYEKDINLAISKVLERKLSEKGALVYMVREDDIDFSSKYDYKKKRGDLYRRILFIGDQEKKTDIYLSIHINWYKNPAHYGAEVLYHNINPNNAILAESIMESFKKDLNSRRSVKKTDLYLYKNTRIPGILIECGFLSNPNERYLLRQEDYQEKLSISIANGVINYFQALNTNVSG